MVRNIYPIMVMIVSLWAVPCQAGNDAVPAGDLREKATIIYHADFVVDAPLVLWNKIVDHPLLMGKLWNLYNFQPAYEVTATEKGIRVVDSLGLNCEFVLIDASVTGRTFHCRGSINHWAVPSFISAEGLFVFHYKEDGQRIQGNFEVFLRGDNMITDFLLELAAGKLKIRLHNRFTHNLEDMKKIVFDLCRHPDRIRSRLAAGALEEFNSLF
ncbi:MAG: hypothetical protein V1766_10200 [Pseudomonadota bacterium]